MEVYLQLANLWTILLGLLLLLDYSDHVVVADDIDDMDLGIEADLLLNTLASAFLDTGGVKLGGSGTNTDGECKFKCPNGVKPKKNPDHIPVSNGCGAYGLKIDLSKLPNIEKCCHRHDKCYGTCNKKMSACDESFGRCLQEMCGDLEDSMGLTGEEAEGCTMVAQLMYSTVQGLGCNAYLDSQKEACICPEKSNKTRRSTEL